MADVAASEQFKARDWFGEVEVGGMALVAPGAPYKMMGTPCELSRTAFARGADNGTVFASDFAWANADVPAPTGGDASNGPLTGVRVIEVTANWAGPIGGRHLGDMGADVIKIELARKPATRAIAFTGGQVWPDFHSRAGYFNKLKPQQAGHLPRHQYAARQGAVPAAGEGRRHRAREQRSSRYDAARRELRRAA